MSLAEKVVTVRMSCEEHAALKSAAHAREIPLNQWFRIRAGLGGRMTSLLDDADRQRIRELPVTDPHAGEDLAPTPTTLPVTPTAGVVVPPPGDAA